MQTADNTPSGAQWRITSGDHEAVIVEVGGGVRSYRWRDLDVIDGYGEDEIAPHSAGQVLAPWPNRIRDGRYTFAEESYQLALSEPGRHNAIHGLVNWARWDCVEHMADAVVVQHRLPAQPGYPWQLLLRTRWAVGAEGLRAEHSVTNECGRTAPFGLGVHPYVLLPGPLDELLVHVPAQSRLLVDSRLLPIGAAKVAGTPYDFTVPRKMGRTELDTAFTEVSPENNAVTLTAEQAGVSVSVWADAQFRWWQLFSSDPLPGDRHRRSLGVEPMTCPPDAFRSRRDLVELAAGQTWQASWGITPRRTDGTA